MDELFGDISRIVASRLPRREALKLIAGGFAMAYLGIPQRVRAACAPDETECVNQGVTSCCFSYERCCHAGQCCDKACYDCDPEGNCRQLKCATAPRTICCSNQDGTAPAQCCDRVCEFCDRTQARCLPVCPASTPDCCVKPGGFERGGCCKRGCCNEETGLCNDAGFRISSYQTVPYSKIEVEVRGYGGTGLGSVSVVSSENANIQIPDFPPGIDYVTVTATRVDPSKPARMLLRACPNCDECEECCENGDPVLTQLQISEGQIRTRQTFTDIPKAEHFVIIQNSHPGLRKFHVLVNGQRAAYLRIGPKEVQTIDIAAAMTESPNTITLVGQGRPGASALVLISDVPGPDAKGAREDSKYQPLVQWEPGTAEEGVNMQWGGGRENVM